jgi:hypothetical protein
LGSDAVNGDHTWLKEIKIADITDIPCGHEKEARWIGSHGACVFHVWGAT